MIRNRASASLSRKKKKENLMKLEAQLKVVLFENEKLKKDNGSLKERLESLLAENAILKARAPKQRNFCLLVVLVFRVGLMLSMSLRLDRPVSELSGETTHSGRHRLDFSPPRTSDSVNDFQLDRRA